MFCGQGKTSMKVAVVMGTRPEALKNYSIVKALSELGVPHVVLHTGQHFDANMQRLVFESLGYEPHEVQPGTYTIGKSIDWLTEQYRNHGVDRVLVNGDTAASLAGAIASNLQRSNSWTCGGGAPFVRPQNVRREKSDHGRRCIPLPFYLYESRSSTAFPSKGPSRPDSEPRQHQC